MFYLEFTVKGQPVPKGRPRCRCVPGKIVNGVKKWFPRLYTPEKTAGYESTVASQARAHMLRNGLSTTTEKVSVGVSCYYGDRRIRDLDNCTKAVLDAMNGVVYKDDSQIVRMLLEKELGDSEPRVEITVMSAEIASAGEA